jgi:uncharacterized protein YjeT (DUF2065 family)
MPSATQTNPVSKWNFWAGWIMSLVSGLFMLLDGAMKLVKPPQVIEATIKLGYPESIIFGLGIVLIGCTLIYLFPRTAFLGAILLTGYLGGAVASHVRLEEGLFPILFPVVFASVIWGGLVLRDPRLRALLSLRS